VLEPWLTPSLFYQFLGADQTFGPSVKEIKEHTGMDQKSFCTALGPYEANRQLRRHWKAWVTEQHIVDIKATGATHVRIPVGDWMFKPYDVYDVVQEGVRCNDGALQELDRALELCATHGLGVLLDMHAWIGSQNGLDNSGEAKFIKWASQEEMDNPAGQFAPIGTFDHWAFKGWDWIINSSADWGIAMSLINHNHWAHSIEVISRVVQRYGHHPAVWGLSPVNEVGAWTPMDVLQKFYWEAYGLVRAGAPKWMYVMDSSFRGGEVGSNNFMKGCPNKALDKHPYHAWAPWGRVETYYARSCLWGDEHKGIEDSVDFAVIAGEWSLALDTCAMWLLGFNDMQPGEPRAICDMVPCPCTGGEGTTMADCYLATSEKETQQPGLPLDANEGLRGPFGSGVSGPQFGRCPREMAMQSFEDEYMTTLAHKQIAAFNEGHGWFFWNFRTEFEPHWDYLEAWKRGWFPRNVSDVKALKGMAMCDEGALPLKPTIPPKPKKQPPSWLAKNWLTLLAGALGGALLGVGGTLVAARKKPEEGRPYLAMPGGSA
jgi:glucan 1,3-beta-glucosidase